MPASSATASTATAPATTAAPDLATALAGRTFLSTAVDGFTLVDGTQVTLTFDGANIGAAAGCNQLASTWTLEGDVLVVPPMAQTEMACEPAGADGPGHVAGLGADVAADRCSSTATR